MSFSLLFIWSLERGGEVRIIGDHCPPWILFKMLGIWERQTVRQLTGSPPSNRQFLYFAVSVSLFFLPTTLSSAVSACRLGICKGQVYFLTQDHFARAAEYAIYTVDVPCALGSVHLQFSVNSAFNHGVWRTEFSHCPKASSCFVVNSFGTTFAMPCWYKLLVIMPFTTLHQDLLPLRIGFTIEDCPLGKYL